MKRGRCRKSAVCAAASADGVAIKRAERPEDDPDAMRCDAMRRDADFGKCNCNLLKFVAVAANRDTNRRRRRLNKTRKTNAAPKKKKTETPTGAMPAKSFGHVFCHAFV